MAAVVSLLTPGFMIGAQAGKQRFDVPSGAAEMSLKKFSEQSGLEVLFPTGAARAIKTNAVKGEFTPREALHRMVSGTGLKVREDEKSGAFAITPEEVGSEAKGAPKAAGTRETPGDLAQDSKKKIETENQQIQAPMKRNRLLTTLAIAYGVLTGPVDAQTAPAATDNATEKDDEAIVLSPFQVSASSDEGYAARETLAGSRLKTELKDVPSQISIMTPEFLEDIATVDIEDAYRYSINVENADEFVSATASGGHFSDGSIYIYERRNRVRGLVTAGRSHDFFQTFIPGDTYNTERLTFSSGPNSILFGNGSPAGIIDTAFKRADVRRDRYSLSVRVDDEASLRTSTDLNKAIIKDKLAVRLAATKSDQNHWRRPAGEEAERLYVSITARPFKSTTIRGYYEDVFIDRVATPNTLVGDMVTPWINAGRPAFDNGLTSTAPNPVNADPVFARNTGPRQVLISGAAVPVGLMIWGATGTSTAPSVPYSALTKGPGNSPYQSGGDSYLYSLRDTSIFPLDVSIFGNGTHNRFDGEVKGLIVEQRIGRNLFIEAGLNEEDLVNPATDYLRGAQRALQADANLYLPDRVTPNPNFGRYFVEGAGRGVVYLRRSRELRLMASYDLDPARNGKFSKWVGSHRFAVMYQRTHSVSSAQDALARLVPAGTPLDAASLATLPANAFQLVSFRSYLSNPADPSTGGKYYFELPYDPFEPHVMPDGSTIYQTNNPYGGTQESTVNHTLLEGRLFAMNNRFLDGRVVTTFGWREDNVRGASYQVRRLNPNTGIFESILHAPVSSDWSDYKSGTTFTGGVVAHLRPWLSVFYNKSDTWNPPQVGLHQPDDSTIPGSIGEGHDYGLMLRFFGDRVSLRLNKYKNTSGPDVSAFRDTIRGEVLNIEETIYDAAVEGLIPSYPAGGTFDPTATDGYYGVMSDRVSKGYEFELVANPTSQWRLSFNVAKVGATESNIAKPWIAFINERMPIWAQYADLRGPSSEGAITLLGNRVIGLIGTLNTLRQTDGMRVEQGRNWRANVVTRYSFREGLAKGIFIGGGARWRSRAVVGHRAITIPNEFGFPGAGESLIVPSVKAPIYGRQLVEVEGFVGYTRRTFKGRIDWRVQLNIRNLLDDDAWIEQRANTSGFDTVYSVPQPRSFILTNTFSF